MPHTAGGKAGGPRPWRRKGTSSVAHDPKLALKSQASGAPSEAAAAGGGGEEERDVDDQTGFAGQDSTFSKVWHERA